VIALLILLFARFIKFLAQCMLYLSRQIYLTLHLHTTDEVCSTEKLSSLCWLVRLMFQTSNLSLSPGFILARQHSPSANLTIYQHLKTITLEVFKLHFFHFNRLIFLTFNQTKIIYITYI